MDIPLCVKYFSCQCLVKKKTIPKCLVEHNNCFKKNEKFVLLHIKNVVQIQISSLRKENGANILNVSIEVLHRKHSWSKTKQNRYLLGNVLVKQTEKSQV